MKMRKMWAAIAVMIAAAMLIAGCPSTPTNKSPTASMFADKGVACKTHLLIRGMAPGEDLIEFAKEAEVDEIIVGVKRRSKVGKLLMGSTAQYVILQAACPVVSVK